MKEEPDGGRFSIEDATDGLVGIARKDSRLFRRSGTRARRRALHVDVFCLAGRPYELSKNLHRLASSRALRLAPSCIAAPQRGQFQLAGPAAAIRARRLRCGVVASSWRPSVR